MNDRLRQILVLTFAIGQAVAGYWSNVAFDPNVGEISDSFENYFTPAGITFAVWGYLYLALIVYGVYQALPAQRERTIHRRVGWWVAVGCASSMLWPIVFSRVGLFGTESFQIVPLWLSVGLIVLLTLSLAVAVVRLRGAPEALTHGDSWFVALPILSYLAWASVATIANVTTLLQGLGWDGGSNAPLWSVAMIVIATLLVVGVIWGTRSRLGSFGFAVVILWAFAGIYLGNNTKSSLVGTVALVAMAVVALVYAWRMFMPPPSLDQPTRLMNA
jgi:hypothetical protein